MEMTLKLFGILIKRKGKRIDKELVKVLLHEMMKKNTTPGLGEEISIEGYTRATIVIKHKN